jgi:hypothetical protein
VKSGKLEKAGSRQNKYNKGGKGCKEVRSRK